MLVLLLPYNARVFVLFSSPRLQRTLEKKKLKKNKENKFQYLNTVTTVQKHLTLYIAKKLV